MPGLIERIHQTKKSDSGIIIVGRPAVSGEALFHETTTLLERYFIEAYEEMGEYILITDKEPFEEDRKEYTHRVYTDTPDIKMLEIRDLSDRVDTYETLQGQEPLFAYIKHILLGSDKSYDWGEDKGLEVETRAAEITREKALVLFNLLEKNKRRDERDRFFQWGKIEI